MIHADSVLYSVAFAAPLRRQDAAVFRHGTGEDRMGNMSEAFLQMAGVFSQLELAMIRARVRSGMENARAKGRRIGRPQLAKEDIPAAFLRHYPAYKSESLNVSELVRVCNISRTQVYKYIGMVEGLC